MAFKSQRPIREQIKLAKEQQAFGKKMSLANLLLQGITTGVGAYQGIQKGRYIGSVADVAQGTQGAQISAGKKKLDSAGLLADLMAKRYEGAMPYAKLTGEAKELADAMSAGAEGSKADYVSKLFDAKAPFAAMEGSASSQLAIEKDLAAKDLAQISRAESEGYYPFAKEAGKSKGQHTIYKSYADQQLQDAQIALMRAKTDNLATMTGISSDKWRMYLDRALKPKGGGVDKKAIEWMVKKLEVSMKSLEDRGLEASEAYKKMAAEKGKMLTFYAAKTNGINFNGGVVSTGIPGDISPMKEAKINSLNNKLGGAKGLTAKEQVEFKKSVAGNIDAANKVFTQLSNPNFKPGTKKEGFFETLTSKPVNTLKYLYNRGVGLLPQMKKAGYSPDEIQVASSNFLNNMWASGNNMIDIVESYNDGLSGATSSGESPDALRRQWNKLKQSLESGKPIHWQ